MNQTSAKKNRYYFSTINTSMKEIIFNLFLYIEDDIVCEIGAMSHVHEGSDEDKTGFLQDRVIFDSETAIRIPVPLICRLSTGATDEPHLRYETFKMMWHQQQHLDVFEPLFQELAGSQSPLFVITPIVSGKSLVDEVLRSEGRGTSRISRIESHQFAPNYLIKYMTADGFDFPRLLNDDFMSAIRLAFNNRHYVSAMKLLVSFIDTVAFLAYGDDGNVFKKFLLQYADLSSLGITSDELWEFRNSILHMTNNESRQVARGVVKRLTFYVGDARTSIQNELDGTKLFNQLTLINVVSKALEKWITDLNDIPSKTPGFFERYDKVLSDSRLDMIKFVNE